jgi:hypothetical protein
MLTHTWHGKEQSDTIILRDLWEMYKGAWPMTCDDKFFETPFLQMAEMLQEIIRRDMRATHESYLHGKATADCVSEIRGHAVLLGKIIAGHKR